MFGSTSDRLPLKAERSVGSQSPQEEGIIPMKDEKEKEVQQRYQQELSKYRKQVEKNDREKKKVA